MKFTGSFFVEDEINVQSSITGSGVVLVADGTGGLFLHMSEDMAHALFFELRAVLDGMEHDRG